MLLGCTEFTKVYLQIKDNSWEYVSLVKLTQDSGISDDEVIELLKLANGHLPRIRLEYDRLKAELNSLEDQKSNSAWDYYQLRNEISEMETTKSASINHKRSKRRKS